jgi:hypothetical protein
VSTPTEVLGAGVEEPLTEEWTPLEPGVIDHNYIRGVGTALEQTVKGGDERKTLISIRHG